MIIIIEGMDRCGKTTLIQSLQTKLTPDTPLVLKYSNIRGITPEQHKQYYLDIYKKTFDLFFINKSVILDRFILGEHVYSPLYRQYSTEDLYNLECSFLKRYPEIEKQIYLLLLLDDPENLIKREDGLSLSQANIKNLKTEYISFINAFNLCKINNKLLININGKTISDVKDIVFNFLGFEEK